MDRNDERTLTKNENCPAVENPLTTYARLLRVQIELADELEHLADSLPDNFDQQRCRELAETIPSLFDVTLSLTQEFLHPTLLRRAQGQNFSPETVSRLKSERLMDQGYAIEVNGLLLKLAGRRDCCDMNAAGYLLRGFFENWRRACAFELEYVMPLATKHLTRDDLAGMAALLERQRMVTAPACTSTRLAFKSPPLHRAPRDP